MELRQGVVAVGQFVGGGRAGQAGGVIGVADHEEQVVIEEVAGGPDHARRARARPTPVQAAP